MVGILIRTGNLSLGGSAGHTAGCGSEAASAAARHRLGLASLFTSSFGYCVFGALSSRHFQPQQRSLEFLHQFCSLSSTAGQPSPVAFEWHGSHIVHHTLETVACALQVSGPVIVRLRAGAVRHQHG